MAFIHGKSATVLFADNDLSSYLNELGVTQAIETGETTTFKSDAKTFVVGLRDGTASLSGLFDGSADAIDEVLAASISSDTKDTATLSPAAPAVGVVAYLVDAHTGTYEVSSPVADVVSVTTDIQSDNAIERGILLTDGSAVSSTSSVTAADNGASTSNGALAHLHVTANDRDGAITVKVQHSADNLSWADLVTFTAVTASTTTAESKTVTGTVNRYVRADYTVAGSSGSATINVAIARR